MNRMIRGRVPTIILLITGLRLMDLRLILLILLILFERLPRRLRWFREY